MTAHPNAAASAATGSLGVIIIAVAQHFGITVEPAVAGAAVGCLTTVVLLIGSEGVKGLAGVLWHGQKDEVGS